MEQAHDIDLCARVKAIYIIIHACDYAYDECISLCKQRGQFLWSYFNYETYYYPHHLSHSGISFYQCVLEVAKKLKMIVETIKNEFKSCDRMEKGRCKIYDLSDG